METFLGFTFNFVISLDKYLLSFVANGLHLVLKVFAKLSVLMLLLPSMAAQSRVIFYFFYEKHLLLGCCPFCNMLDWMSCTCLFLL